MAVLENKKQLPEQEIPPEAYPDVEKLVTEDDTPVDNIFSIFSEKQQRLLTRPLYSSWAGPGGGRPSWPWRTWGSSTPSRRRRWCRTCS